MNKITNHQLYRLVVAHFAEIIREPAVIFWGVIFPILMAWGLGIAFTQKTGVHAKIAIVRTEQTIDGRKSKLFAGLTENGIKKDSSYLVTLKNEKLGDAQLNYFETSSSNAYRLLKKGKVSVIIEDSNRGSKYSFDPSSQDAKAAYQLAADFEQNGTKSYAKMQESIVPLTLKGSRYVDFLIPGLLGMGIMMACCWGISYTIIDRRSKKLLRRMVATPMRKTNLLIALITARFFMNLAEAILLFIFAWIYFDVTIQGSVSALILLFMAGNIAFSGIAILISSRTASSEVGNGMINAIVTPMMVVSGVFFSYHNFPDWAVSVIQYLPLSMIADGFRTIFNEGGTFVDVWREAVILASVGVSTFVIGIKTFKWY
ncbi:MAG: ABC transporter permease [Bacteroidia bacterium]|nr:ABC transporter permease [Bacteroidia bacterium]